MSSLLSAELAATCNALGYFDEQRNKYYADANTLETAKDLIRFLRRDDEKHDIRRQLGETKVVQTDLLPLMKSYWEEDELFDVVLRLLVNLTTPALMLWNAELPTDPSDRNQYLRLEEHLRLYKQAFADETVWAVLSTKISKILEIDSGVRGEDNGLIIVRILILIRNILSVPDDPHAEKRPDNDVSVHDQVLWALHQSGMLDIILYISSGSEEAFYMHILEILSYMLREQNASELANAALQRSQTEKLRDEAELLAMRHKEKSQKQQKAKFYNSTRHSRFGGTFVVKSMKSISDNELIYHKPLNKLDALNFDAGKTKSKTRKTHLPMQSISLERRSAFSIRLFLKEFCIDFLNGAYNTLMSYVKGTIARAQGQQHDESYYLWAMRFFMEFNRCHKFEVKLVSETMSVQSFHFVQQQMEKFFDMMSSDKKKLHLWSRRLHLALLAYRELLLTVCAMDKSSDESVRKSAMIIKSNIFYVLEYRELILTLLVTFDECKESLKYLTDLIETQHVFLKMLQAHCTGGHVMVQAKSKAPRRKKKKAARKSQPQPTSSSASSPSHEFNLNNMWDEVSTQLSAVLQGSVDFASDVAPFDPASDVPIDEQKPEAMKKIQRKLRNNEFENAIGLLRAARDVWPENDDFGSANMSVEEEFGALKEIFFADLGENAATTIDQKNDGDGGDEGDVSDEYEDEEDELEASMRISESDFKFEDFTKRLVHSKVVRACGLVLRNFDRNSALTNHCITKLLHRIAVDSKMPTMIFQVSIFQTFQKIFEARALPQYKELVKFATYIVRQFFQLVGKNEHIFMECLFWKSPSEAYELEEGYGSYKKQRLAEKRSWQGIWTEEQENELRRLFMEHQEKNIETDVVDWIVNNLIDNRRNRRMVLKKLKEMYLLTDHKGRRKSGISSGRGAPRQWGVEEEAQLRELYEQFKDAMDPLTCIMERLSVHRPKNRIVEKLLVMGLVQDKKELRKKRAGAKSGRKQVYEDDLLPTTNSESEGEDDGQPRGSQSSTTNKQTSANPTMRKTKAKKTTTSSSSHARNSYQQIAPILLSLVETGLHSPLEWIKETIQDIIDDLESNPEEDCDEGVPLVPIMDSAVAAMDHPEFLKLLYALGFQEPSDEQETYWRIPSTLSIATLKTHLDSVTKALDGTLTIPDASAPITENAPPEPPQIENSLNNADDDKESSSSDDEDVFERVKAFIKKDDKVVAKKTTIRKASVPITTNAPPEPPQIENSVNNADDDNESSSSDDEDVFEKLKAFSKKDDKVAEEKTTIRKASAPITTNAPPEPSQIENSVNNADDDNESSSSDDEDVFEKVKAFIKKDEKVVEKKETNPRKNMKDLIKRLVKDTNAKKNSIDLVIVDAPAISSSQASKKRIQIQDESSDDDDNENSLIPIGDANDDEGNRLSFKPRLIHDDTDDEDVISAAVPQQTSPKSTFKSIRLFESDSDEAEDDIGRSDKEQQQETNLAAVSESENSGNVSDHDKENVGSAFNIKNNTDEERSRRSGDNKRSRSADSDTEFSSRKRVRKIIDSDSDEE